MERYNLILKNKDFDFAVKTIEKKEADRIFCRHGMQHLLDTARIAYILVLENNLNIDKDVVYAAAMVHDLGRLYGAKNHRDESCVMAEKILKDCRYTDKEIEMICTAVKNHGEKTAGKTQTGRNIKNLTEALAEADRMSRQCYDCGAGKECYWREERRNLEIKY